MTYPLVQFIYKGIKYVALNLSAKYIYLMQNICSFILIITRKYLQKQTNTLFNARFVQVTHFIGIRIIKFSKTSIYFFFRKFRLNNERTMILKKSRQNFLFALTKTDYLHIQFSRIMFVIIQYIHFS